MKTKTLLFLALLTATYAFAQNGINYKAVIKDGGGNIVSNQSVTIQFKILQNALVVYSELHTLSTDVNGILIANIGEGAPAMGSPLFSSISWGDANHFLNVLVDTGAGLVDLGTTQFKTVPYALYAANTSLEPRNEGNGIGHIIKGRNPLNYGVIGLNAVDASVSPNASTTYGATGESSFAANRQTTAQGAFATAFGLDSKAYGNTSVTMGFNTVTNGFDAVAMGAYTIADAAQSLVIGRYNVGGGSNQVWNSIDPVFEIGNGTGSGAKANALTVLKNGKMGLGISPVEDFHVGLNKSVLFGSSTQGSGTKMMWLPALKAFRAGGVNTSNWNTPAIGEYSFASGYNTIAEGYGSFAVGNRSWANNLYAFASGYFTNAHGAYSTAMGYNTDALAQYSTAFGYNTDATGYYATSMGHTTQAQAYASTAVGRYNVGGGTAASWVETDPLFEIGNGTSTGARNNAITVLKNGKVGFNFNNPAYDLDINGDVRIVAGNSFNLGPAYMQYLAGNNFAVGSNIVPLTNSAYTLGDPSHRWIALYAVNGTIQTSDIRDKTNINDVGYGMADIMKLKPVSFNWKNNPDRDTKLGLIAQDLLKVIPEVVNTEEFVSTDSIDAAKGEYKPVDRLGVFYSDIIPVLIKGMQEQQGIIEDQQRQIDELKTLVLNSLNK